MLSSATGRQNVMRPHGEPKTLVFNDDGDFASKDSIFADGRLKDMNHPNRENAIVVCVNRSYTHTQLINTLLNISPQSPLTTSMIMEHSWMEW